MEPAMLLARHLKFASLGALVVLASACAQPLGSAPVAGGGGAWTGGAIGQPCNTQSQGEGCAAIDGVVQVVSCDASGVWTGKEPCLNGASCVEQMVEGSTKRVAACVGGNVSGGQDAGSSSSPEDAGAVVDGITMVDSGTTTPDSGSTQADTGGGVAPVMPLPTIELKDFNPGSPTFGQMIKLEQFAGKYVVVLMGAGWCASCNAQADFLEKIKLDLEKKGRDDFVMFTLNDKSAGDPNNQKLMYTCDYGAVCPAKGKPLSYPVLQGTAKYGWTTFIDTKSGNAKGAKNDCFIYAKDGTLKFKHVGKGTVNLTQFDQEVRAALK
jgi:thiol-disulfide isomerase/thioredoxin